MYPLSPTLEEVRVWGYDPKFEFSEQDEDLLLYKSAYAPVLLELMSNPNCPKGNFASSILWDFSRLKVLHKQGGEILALERVWTQVQFDPAPRVRAWVAYFSRLLHYTSGQPFKVSALQAEQMARELLMVYLATPVETRPRLRKRWFHFGVPSNYFLIQLEIEARTGVWEYQMSALPRT